MKHLQEFVPPPHTTIDSAIHQVIALSESTKSDIVLNFNSSLILVEYNVDTAATLQEKWDDIRMATRQDLLSPWD